MEVFFAPPFGIGGLNLNALAFEGNALGFVGLALEAGDIGAEVQRNPKTEGPKSEGKGGPGGRIQIA